MTTETNAKPAPREIRVWPLFTHPLPWLLLLAVAVRLVGLTYHSLWFDEVMSTFWAGKAPQEIWHVGLQLTQDKHPPLYYLMLHGWTGIFGPGDVAVRTLGVLIGALAVLPTYGIGAWLGGKWTAALGAMLVALNPFLVWYSQEARMFMPATTFVLAGLYGLLETQRSQGSRQALGLVLLVGGLAAALYTYLFSAFALPVAGMWLVLLGWQGRYEAGNRRRFLLGLGALALVMLVFLPLTRSAWLVSGQESMPGRAFQDMNRTLPKLMQVYAVGWPGWGKTAETWLAVAAGLLALMGMMVPRRWLRCSDEASVWTVPPAPVILRAGGLYLASWIAVPLLLGGLLLARDRTVFSETRYFTFLVPALCLAWGRALAAVWAWRRWAGGVALVAVVAISLPGLRANWSPEQRREAWRDAAAYVAANAGPNDAILIHADYVHVAFDRYFDGSQPLFYPFTDPLVDQSQIAGPLEGLSTYDAVWLVQSHNQELDPAGLIAAWFAARYPLITEQYPAGIAVRGFATNYRPPDIPGQSGREPVTAQFGLLRLLDCRYDDGPVAARDDLFHPPSGWVHVTTYWTTTAPVETDLFPTVQLVDEAGQVWGDKLERGSDAIHIWPTSRWQPGEVVRVDYDVNLNPVTPAGRYRVVVGVEDLGETVVCGDLEVK